MHESRGERARECTQKPGESICDFVFQYRALCIRWKSQMTEREIVQAMLCNCNPRVACVLRRTVTVVCLGMLVKRDFDAAKEYPQKQLPSPARKTPRDRGLSCWLMDLCKWPQEKYRLHALYRVLILQDVFL